MTISVHNSPNSGVATDIGISITSGNVSVSVSEPYTYLRSVWSEMGRLLDDKESKFAVDPVADYKEDVN